jgi:hypothetical protein
VTYLASAAAYLATWIGRANQAWGASRVWNSGQSFEQDSAMWHGRADQAWGTSRAWNSGSSFEADLAAMTADRNTWKNRADQAWGPTRVWNSGESWEAAYNRVLPPAGVSTWSCTYNASGAGGGNLSMSAFSNPDASRFTNIGSGVVIQKAGYYAIYLVGNTYRGNYGGNNTYLNVAGPQGTAQYVNVQNGNSRASYQGMVQLIGAGQSVTMGFNGQDGNSSCNGQLVVSFVPMQTYPH